MTKVSINYFTEIPDILLCEVSKVQKKLYSILPLHEIEDETELCVCVYLYWCALISAKTNTMDKLESNEDGHAYSWLRMGMGFV